jgi:hypothetical protein
LVQPLLVEDLVEVVEIGGLELVELVVLWLQGLCPATAAVAVTRIFVSCEEDTAREQLQLMLLVQLLLLLAAAAGTELLLLLAAPAAAAAAAAAAGT